MTRLGVAGSTPAGRYLVRGEPSCRTASSVEADQAHVSKRRSSSGTPPDRGALERIARRTGGSYLTPEGVDTLASNIDLAPRHVPVVSESVLRASAPWFIAVLLLLSAEWLLRKRAGMI
jgi:hypothetical protein